ncbi:MAG: orc1/cdc6 family replication initiation protein [Candidatus Methanoplasma sp.]|jgi:cell division control protein 6|nr:orc1/cdc6 family replication initiation protein [Candidatus Methanoplasma sp.]
MSIFDSSKNKRSTLIKDRNILQTTYIPDQLPHRESEISSIVEILTPALFKNKPSNILVTGKTGTGKTAVVNYIGKELKKEDPEERNCCFTYVNCEIVDNTYGILFNISNQITTDQNKIPFTGWSLDRVYDTMLSDIEKGNKIFIIVLDEIDRIFQKSGDDIFYFLTSMNEVLKNSKVSIIGITNNTKFAELLTSKIKSRLGEEKIIFPPYKAEQLQNILKKRAELAFEPGVLEEAVIPYCAALSAQDSGDARRALDLLRVSAEVAERNGDAMITEAHVMSARNQIEKDTVKEVIETLPAQSKIVLKSIIEIHERKDTTVTTGYVYSVYKEMCNSLNVNASKEKMVANIISELDMLGIIHARVKSFGRNGRTREIELNISKDIIEFIKKDELFEPLLKHKPVRQTKLL